MHTLIPDCCNALMQACGKIPVSVSELAVDYLSIAGQKVRFSDHGSVLKCPP